MGDLFIFYTVIAIIFLAIIVLVYCKRKDALLKTALYIVAKVEKEWGSKMGEVKFAEAYSYLKEKFPVLTFFIPQSVLKNIIEEALDNLKNILASKVVE